jgi:ribonuclease T2
MFIRTALLKGSSYDAARQTLKFGAGMVFTEAHTAAAKVGRYIASGWASTVGVVGWATGGGHGPFAPSAGLGVDQIVEVDIVTADAKLQTVNAQQQPDLFWALRGGGGSAWGVITAITYKTYPIPKTGFSRASAYWQGSFCRGDDQRLDTILNAIFSWQLHMGREWGGLVFVTTAASQNPVACAATWNIYANYVFLGAPTDAGYQMWHRLNTTPGYIDLGVTTWDTWAAQINQQPIENIIPTTWLPTGPMSVLVSRDLLANASFASLITQRARLCLQSSLACGGYQFYQALTGNKDSPNFSASAVSISAGFRKAIVHMVTGMDREGTEQLYQMAPHSYFSESEYNMTDGYQARYWGDNYPRLLSIKREVDAKNRFWCQQCVGSDV